MILPAARAGDNHRRGEPEGCREQRSQHRQGREPALSRAADPQRPDLRAARGGMKLDLDASSYLPPALTGGGPDRSNTSADASASSQSPTTKASTNAGTPARPTLE